MQQIETARLVVKRGLSVRDTERMIGRLVKGLSRKKPHRVTDRDILRLQEDLSQKLGTKVVIKPGSKGHGALIIDYTSLAQLDAILARVMR
jgi:ParB family chromosome partitioning protein